VRRCAFTFTFIALVAGLLLLRILLEGLRLIEDTRLLFCGCNVGEHDTRHCQLVRTKMRLVPQGAARRGSRATSCRHVRSSSEQVQTPTVCVATAV
jgi:hypothetical protein